MKMKLKTEVARDLVDMSDDDEDDQVDGWAWVAEVEGGEGRWERHMQTVLKGPDGGYWAFKWSRGLTEYQDNAYPWGGTFNNPQVAEIDVYRVRPVDRIVTDWVRA